MDMEVYGFFQFIAICYYYLALLCGFSLKAYGPSCIGSASLGPASQAIFVFCSLRQTPTCHFSCIAGDAPSTLLQLVIEAVRDLGTISSKLGKIEQHKIHFTVWHPSNQLQSSQLYSIQAHSIPQHPGTVQ